jgi:hypothetical protein
VAADVPSLIPKVPTLLYIGKRGRVYKRAIGVEDCFLVCYNKLIESPSLVLVINDTKLLMLLYQV